MTPLTIIRTRCAEAGVPVRHEVARGLCGAALLAVVFALLGLLS